MYIIYLCLRTAGACKWCVCVNSKIFYEVKIFVKLLFLLKRGFIKINIVCSRYGFVYT